MTSRGSTSKAKKKGGQGRRVSIYLPADLASKIADKPGINLSRVVRRALTAQFEQIEDVDEYGSALARVRDLEMKNFAMTEGHAAICRASAKHAGLIVLSQEEWDQTTERQVTVEREIRELTATNAELETKIDSLENQLREARGEAATLKERRSFFTEERPVEKHHERPEDASASTTEPTDVADARIDRTVDAAFPREGTCGKCEYLSFVDGCCSKIGSDFLDQERSPDDQKCDHYWPKDEHPEDDESDRECVSCHVRFDSAQSPDTYCKQCHKPMCWGCFAGDTGVGEDPVGLCSDCQKAADDGQEVSGGDSGPASGEEGATADPDPPPSSVETPAPTTSDKESSEEDLPSEVAS
jgi:hypothetical protein